METLSFFMVAYAAKKIEERVKWAIRSQVLNTFLKGICMDAVHRLNGDGFLPQPFLDVFAKISTEREGKI